MSVTRIGCPKCGFPIVWCQCGKPASQSEGALPESTGPAKVVAAVAAGWAEGLNPAEISKETREAYCGLFDLPLPKTEIDFRRALIMAVLIGRQIEGEISPPNRPGAEAPKDK